MSSFQTAGVLLFLILAFHPNEVAEGQTVPPGRHRLAVAQRGPLLSFSPWFQAPGHSLVFARLEPLGYPGLLTPVEPRLEAFLQPALSIAQTGLPISGPSAGRRFTLVGGGLLLSGALLGGDLGRATAVAGFGIGLYGLRFWAPEPAEPSPQSGWRTPGGAGPR